MSPSRLGFRRCTALSSEGGAAASNRSFGSEDEVAVFIAPGCSNKQVGTRLGITEVTVRSSPDFNLQQA